MAKRTTGWLLTLTVGSAVVGGTGVGGNGPLIIAPVLVTDPLSSYEDAPATPDADDPAIWVHRGNPRQSLVIGTAKDAGLLAYDMSGRLVQALFPPNAPPVLSVDPPTPAGVNAGVGQPCVDSDSGETFGRFNNVDIAYDVQLSPHPSSRVDVAVVSDRGCDRIRFYKIDPADPEGPLVDITAANVPRVFPSRYEQPSPLQPSGAIEGWRDNPVDDQNTVYGLTVTQGAADEVFVSQRERGLVKQLQIVPAAGGRLTYQLRRTFLFDTSFSLRNEQNISYDWTPCREAALEEPQSEGVVFDRVTQTLYVAFETIGLYRLPLNALTPAFQTVTDRALVEPVRSFGQPYHAVPDDEEFECDYNPAGAPAPDDVVAPGSPANGGQFLEADLEGLSVIASRRDKTLLLASSQGDSSFHFYEIGQGAAVHRGVFFVEGVGDTDGVHYVPIALGRQFPVGLLVVQNGEAPEPPDTGDVNGYEFDGATQFMYLNFQDALRALRP